MRTLTWREAYSLESKRGNPWVTIPTREMLLGLDVRRIVIWKIDGHDTTIEIIFDRDYAVEWGRTKLRFLSRLPNEDREKYINELFGGAEKSNDHQSSTTTKAKKRNKNMEVSPR